VIALLVLVTVALLLAPSVANTYWLRVLSGIFMFAVLGQGINLMAGYTGYPAFGNVVFFGLGGYVTAILMSKLGLPFAVAAPAAAVIAPLIVLPVMPMVLRLKGHYFAIATLGLNEAAREVVTAARPLTGGAIGMTLPLPDGGPASNAAGFYYVFLALMLASVWLTAEFGRRRLGHCCQAIRDNEDKAEAMGLPTLRCKVMVWMLSATLTAAAGAVNAYWVSYIDPPSVFDMAIAVKAFVIFLLGGAGTVLGPVAGAFIVEMLATLTWSHLLNWHLGAMGLLIMLIVLALPDGLPGILARWRNFPADRAGELDEVLADALRQAADAEPEILTVMDPVARPQRLRLARVVGVSVAFSSDAEPRSDGSRS